MRLRPTLCTTLLLLVTSNPLMASDTAIQASEHAKQIAKQALLIDTHIDVPYRIAEKWDDVSKATDGGDFDYPRAVKGGLNAPFMSIYIPANLEKEGKGKSYQLANQLIDSMEP